MTLRQIAIIANIDHLSDVGDGGVAADAGGVDGQPAGGGGGGDDQVSVVDGAVQVGDTHLALSKYEYLVQILDNSDPSIGAVTQQGSGSGVQS